MSSTLYDMIDMNSVDKGVCLDAILLNDVDKGVIF